MKRGRENEEWKVTFEQVGQLRSVVEILNNVLTRTTFKIEDGILHVDNIDAKHVCMVQARLQVVCNHKDPIRFSITCNTLLNCLRACPNHYALEMFKLSDSANIHIKSFELLSNNHQFEADIPTVADDDDDFTLDNMEYNQCVEMELSTLRSTVKTAISLQAQDIRMVVMEPEEQPEGRKVTAFRLIGEGGDAKPCFSFISETNEDENIIRTEESIQSASVFESMTEKYEASFSVTYLNNFLKSMERQTLMMQLSQGKPLVMNYPLGKENSYVKFVLAARV